MQDLYALGARKLILTSTGPLGCLPFEMWSYNMTNGTCNEEANGWVQIYNAKLQAAIQSHVQGVPDLYILYGNAYDKVYAYIQAPQDYGMQFILYTKPVIVITHSILCSYTKEQNSICALNRNSISS